MHLRSLSLRNYRVYRELDLEFPDGLCGIYGANGTGKCLPYSARLFDADAGGMVSISQFVADRRKRTLGLRDGKIQPVEVTDWVALGERPTVEITLKNGARLEAAETHPILTDRGCVQAKDLTSEHWVAEAAVVPQLGPPRLTVDEAMLLGLLLGDGCLVTDSIEFNSGDEAIGELYRNLVERVFPGATVSSTKDPRSRNRAYRLRSKLDSLSRRSLYSHIAEQLLAKGIPLKRYVREVPPILTGTCGFSWDSLCAIEEAHGVDLSEERCALYPRRAAREWIGQLGLQGASAGTKHIPEDCLAMPVEHTWALLAGLWMTDGWVRTTKHRPEVALGTKSRQLADDIRILLRRVNVQSTIRQRITESGPYWTIAIQHGRFSALAQLPLVGPKAGRLESMLARPPASKPGTRSDLIPPSFNSSITAWTSPAGYYQQPNRRHRPMGRTLYRDFAGPGSVADDETIWSRVASVTPTGRSVPCYDIEVDTPEHLYLAETFVVHNSTLIESIRYSLYGESRTSKDELRSADVREDLQATLVFEHEGNTYEVRRGLKGQALTPEARVFCNGQLAVSGVRDANAYLARVVGMRQDAFLASVCAQQKELTAFATMAPSERRRLVLDLLGVRPVEKALTRAREQARDARREAAGGRRALPDLDLREKAVAEAEAELADAGHALEQATQAEADAEEQLARLREATAAAELAARQVEELQQAARIAHAEADAAEQAAAGHAARAQEGEEARGLLAASQARVDALPQARATLEELERAREAQQARQAQQDRVADARARLADAETQLAKARKAAEGLAEAETAVRDAEQALAATSASLEDARARWATATGELRAAEARRDAAQAAAATAHELQEDAPCPTCGQVLGPAFARLREHRDAELSAAGQAVETAKVALARLEREGETHRAAQQQHTRTLEAARQALNRSANAATLAEHAQQGVERARADLESARTALDALPDPAYDPNAHERARQQLAELQAEAARLEGYRARVAAGQREAELAQAARTQAAAARDRAHTAETQAGELAHLETALAQARTAEHAAAAAVQTAHGERRAAAAARDAARRRLADQTTALTAARAAHEQVAAAEEQAAYAEKTAELLTGFRLHLVTRLGGRLTTEAARLFGELTDHTYADLVVDPEDYGIRIADGGIEHELTRFSGSENDLASLSLRVAISLVIADGAGELGLLVLDEVLGSLDRDRRERMLQALTSLQGRFRQVLLVTHNDEVKDLLPAAIEVRRLTGRTSTARLVQ